MDDPDDAFITAAEAARLLACPPFVVTRLIRRRDLPVFGDPLDRRVRLLRRRDVERLRQP
jgi:hypothetical protein